METTNKQSKSALLKFSTREFGTLIGHVILCVVFASITDVFMTERSLVNILQQSSINACVAIGTTLAIISGGIDLSVVLIAALSAVIAATMLVDGWERLDHRHHTRGNCIRCHA